MEYTLPIILLHYSVGQGGIAPPDQIENHGQCLSGIQIVIESVFKRGSRLGVELRVTAQSKPGGTQAEQKLLDALQTALRRYQPVPGEVQLLAIGHGHKEVANRNRIVFAFDEIAEGKEVSFRFRHLLALHQQMLAVYPEADEWFPRDGLALSNFVFVMGKNVVHAAAMDVERFTKLLHRHRGAFNVPPRPAGTEWRLPVWFLLVLRRFPQNKVARLFLLVFVGIDSGADFQFSSIQAGQPAVIGKS